MSWYDLLVGENGRELVPSSSNAGVVSFLLKQGAIFRQEWSGRIYKRSFLDCLLWCAIAQMHGLATYVLLTSGVLFHLGLSMERAFFGQRTSLIDITVILLCACYGGLTYPIYGPLRRKWLDVFLQIHSFSLLHNRCCRIAPLQISRFRVSQMMAFNPSLFTYSFSGSLLVVRIKKKEDISLSESNNVSTTVEPLILSQPQENIVGDQHQNTGEEQIGPSPATDGQEFQEVDSKIEGNLSLVVFLGQTISLWLREKNPVRSEEQTKNDRFAVHLTHMAYQALIAYLAIQEPGKLVSHIRLQQDIYKQLATSDDMQQAFNTHISRIRKQIRADIKTNFPHWMAYAEKFDIFVREQRGRGQWYWGLSDSCRVSGLRTLNRSYWRIHALRHGSKQKHPIDEIDEKDLLEIASELIKHYSGNYLLENGDEEKYSGGYLIQLIDEDYFGDWAREFFKDCRKKYMYIIEYVAQCEQQLWRKTKRQEHLDRAVEFYKECAYAATCAPIDSKLGEAALRSCINALKENDDFGTMSELCDVYAKRVQRIEARWMPERETNDLLHEIGFVPE